MQKDYSTHNKQNARFYGILAVLIAVIIALIVGIRMQDTRKTWDVEYPMVNQHVDYTYGRF